MTSYGQVGDVKPFRKTDYAPSNYSIKTDTFDFRNLKIELTQAKLLDYKTYNSTASYCRIWLTVRKENTIIDELYIHSCEALGGCSGIYASKNQTRQDFFILSKFGDYDGRILIIDTSGKINSYIEGHYYLSSDNKYLFSSYSSDLSGLTVYDLSKNQVLFISDSVSVYLGDFYYSDNKYFAIVSNDVKEINQTDIINYDFKTNKLIVTTVDNSYLTKAVRLKSFNIFTYPPCDCGQTKK